MIATTLFHFYDQNVGGYHVDQPARMTPTRAVSEPTNIMELGLAIATISRDLVTKFDLPGNQKGVVVTEVSPDGSAAKHGIKAGDVILAIQQAEVDAPLAVQKEVDAAKKDGRSSVLMLTQQRHGPTLYVPVPLPRSIDAMAPTAGADLPPSQPGPSMPARAVSEPTNIMELGLAIDTISRDLVTKFDLPGNQKGVVVTEVSPDGSAAKHGIKAGDVILAIQEAEVDAPLAVQKEVDAAKKDGRSSVLMLTQQRHGPTLYVPVPLPRSIDAMAPTAGADLPPSQPGPSMPARAVSEPTNIMELGLAINTVSRDFITKFDLPGNQKGVVVTEVSPDGSAAKHGIKAGDVILAIQQAEVDTPGSAKGSGRSEERRPKQRANANPTTARPEIVHSAATGKTYWRFRTVTERDGVAMVWERSPTIGGDLRFGEGAPMGRLSTTGETTSQRSESRLRSRGPPSVAPVIDLSGTAIGN